MAGAQWEAIKYVSGISTLVAFTIATAALVLRRWIRSREELIRLAPEAYRPRLIDKALGVSVAVDDLAKRDRRDLFVATLGYRERQLRTTFLFVIMLTVLAALTYAVTLFAPRKQAQSSPKFGELIFEQWKEDQSDFVRQNGLSTDDHHVNVWFQFFTDGIILHNTPNRVSWVLDMKSGTYQTFPNPDRLISEHNKPAIDWELFERSCKAPTAEREPYRQLIRQRSIIGGIGTLYVTEALLLKIGPPQALGDGAEGTHKEDLMTDVRFSRGPNYDLVLGLPNRASDKAGDRITRAGYALFKNGTFQKFIVNLNNERRALAST